MWSICARCYKTEQNWRLIIKAKQCEFMHRWYCLGCHFIELGGRQLLFSVDTRSCILKSVFSHQGQSRPNKYKSMFYHVAYIISVSVFYAFRILFRYYHAYEAKCHWYTINLHKSRVYFNSQLSIANKKARVCILVSILHLDILVSILKLLTCFYMYREIFRFWKII